MYEDEHHNLYHQMNPQGCVFQKTILLNYGTCKYSERKYVDERELVACQAKNARHNCQVLLNTLRNNACFALKVTKANSQLHHSKEVKVQVAGLYRLQQYLDNSNVADTVELSDKFRNESLSASPIDNIHSIVTEALSKFGVIKNFPYSEMVKTIIHFSMPSRNKRKK